MRCLGGYIPDQVVTSSQNQLDPKTEGKKVTAEGEASCAGQWL